MDEVVRLSGLRYAHPEMGRFIIVVLMFLGLFALALVCTAIVYGMVYGVMFWLCLAWGLPTRFSWVPLAITALIFLTSLITVLRNRMPDLGQLSWDSGTAEDAPSKSYAHTGTGRYWNVNPLGPQSLQSLGAIGAAILGFGPSLAVSALISAVQELGENRRQASSLTQD